MTNEEILGLPAVIEATGRMEDQAAALLFACEQTDAGPFDLPVQADILAAARDYKMAWNARNLAIADAVRRHVTNG